MEQQGAIQIDKNSESVSFFFPFLASLPCLPAVSVLSLFSLEADSPSSDAEF